MIINLIILNFKGYINQIKSNNKKLLKNNTIKHGVKNYV